MSSATGAADTPALRKLSAGKTVLAQIRGPQEALGTGRGVRGLASQQGVKEK